MDGCAPLAVDRIAATTIRETATECINHEHDLIHDTSTTTIACGGNEASKTTAKHKQGSCRKDRSTRQVGVVDHHSSRLYGVFLIVLGWTAIWLSWNWLAPARLQFDPPMAFVFWLFISNVIQILLMPLIMVGQNVQGTHAELRAGHDLEVT